MKVTRFGFFGRVEVEINDNGVIDDEATGVFLQGHCHSLALALHRRTGWPIVGLENDLDRLEKSPPSHCVVYCPQLDDYIDIEGPGAMKRMEEYSEISTKLLMPDEVFHLEGYLQPCLAVGEPYAETVLTELAPVLQSQSEGSNWNRQLKLF